jgi:CRISPR system Cascade subunit CasD
MNRYLILYLEAPMLSFGDAPGNVERGTRLRPTRSALLGLAGAALGVRRDDKAGQETLAASFVTGSATLESGAQLTDFHTFQSLPTAKAKNVATRADALANPNVVTSITRRDYRTDARHLAGYRVRSTDGAVEELTLEALRDAFLTPQLQLWLGRKSCPLSHPLAGKIIDAATMAAAFDAYDRTRPTRHALRLEEIAVEDEADGPAGLTPQVNTLVDNPLDRIAWHFAPRREFVFAPPVSEGRT